jgi:hypothetical protein
MSFPWLIEYIFCSAVKIIKQEKIGPMNKKNLRMERP